MRARRGVAVAGSARMPAPSLGSAPLAPPSTSKALAQGRRLWLYGVGALTVGAVAAALAMAPAAGADPSRGLAWLLFVGSSVHVASTGWLYTVREVRAFIRTNKVRFVWAPVMIIAGSAILAAASPP